MTQLATNFKTYYNSTPNIYDLKIELPGLEVYEVNYIIINSWISLNGKLCAYCQYYGEDETLDQLIELLVLDDISIYENKDKIIELINIVEYQSFGDYRKEFLTDFNTIIYYLENYLQQNNQI